MKYVSPQTLKTFLSSVEYKHPAMHMALFTHPYEGYQRVCLAIQFTVPDAYKHGELQEQCVNVPVPPIVDQEHFNDWLKWRLETIALHELNELYWVDGTVLLDPHSADYWKTGAYYL